MYLIHLDYFNATQTLMRDTWSDMLAEVRFHGFCCVSGIEIVKLREMDIISRKDITKRVHDAVIPPQP